MQKYTNEVNVEQDELREYEKYGAFSHLRVRLDKDERTLVRERVQDQIEQLLTAMQRSFPDKHTPEFKLVRAQYGFWQALYHEVMTFDWTQVSHAELMATLTKREDE